jgi:uncharacterized oligopeptide transporter (OPT) family protein
MSFVAGVSGSTAALERAGMPLSSTTLILLTLALGVLGIALGGALRTRLIAAEGLPFPTGTATAEVIEAMTHRSEHALSRARGLLLGAAVAAASAWLRDAASILPQTLALPLGLAGWSAAELSVSVSPLLLATGMISGAQIGLSMLCGGALAWLVVLPRVIALGVVPSGDHGAATGWLLWPAVALVLSSSLTSLAKQWRTLAVGLRDVRRMFTVAAASSERTASSQRALWLALCVLAAACVLWVYADVFGLPPTRVALALVFATALAVVCARGAGETDIAPAGDMGGLTQLVFGSHAHKASSLACGGLATAIATQTTQMLWAFKAGHKLGARPRSQLIAQLVGVLVGSVVVVPVYRIIASTYGIGSERLPSFSVLSWEATAAAVQGGLSSLPPYAAQAALLAFGLGSLLTLAKDRWQRSPSPVALGIGVLMPLSMTTAIALGAVAVALLHAKRPSWVAHNMESVAGGAIAGESLFAVIMATLIASGLLAG